MSEVAFDIPGTQATTQPGSDDPGYIPGVRYDRYNRYLLPESGDVLTSMSWRETKDSAMAYAERMRDNGWQADEDDGLPDWEDSVVVTIRWPSRGES